MNDDRYQVVPATPDHIAPIAYNVRKGDLEEVWRAGAMTVTDALKMSLEGAQIAYTWLIDGIPAVMGGISDNADGGLIWLLGTDAVDHHQRAFLKDSRKMLDEVKPDYPMLFNFVDCRNKRAIRWLTWLGFSLYGPLPYGVFKQPFYLFRWENKELNQ